MERRVEDEEELDEQNETAVEDEDEAQVGATPDALDVVRSITILDSPEHLHSIYESPGTLAMIMEHFARVSDRGDGKTHWSMDAPLGRTLVWDSQIVENQPGRTIAWRSLPGAEMPNEGEVYFQPGPEDRGTEVKMHFRFDPPGGVIGDAAMKLFNLVPELMISKALRRFKSLAETGEIPTSNINSQMTMQDARKAKEDK
jgi:uncharacterized membrane protein